MGYDRSSKDSPKKKFVPPEVILNGISHDIRRTLSGISLQLDDFEKSLRSRNLKSRIPVSFATNEKSNVASLSKQLSSIVDDADEGLFDSIGEFIDAIDAQIAKRMRLMSAKYLSKAYDLNRTEERNDPYVVRDRSRLHELSTSINRTQRSLVALSKFADKNWNIVYGPINLNSEASRIQGDLIDVVRRTGRSWSDVHIDGEVTISTSQFAVASILGNLITNSLVHGRRRHMKIDIKIEARSLKQLKGEYPSAFKKVSNPSDWAKIQICDDGYGISENDRRRVFELFAQSRSKRSNSSGTGVGLSLVVYALELLGGAIELKSTVNVGTCFLVIIPNGPITGNLPQTILGSSEL